MPRDPATARTPPRASLPALRHCGGRAGGAAALFSPLAAVLLVPPRPARPHPRPASTRQVPHQNQAGQSPQATPPGPAHFPPPVRPRPSFSRRPAPPLAWPGPAPRLALPHAPSPSFSVQRIDFGSWPGGGLHVHAAVSPLSVETRKLSAGPWGWGRRERVCGWRSDPYPGGFRFGSVLCWGSAMKDGVGS